MKMIVSNGEKMMKNEERFGVRTFFRKQMTVHHRVSRTDS